MAFALQQKTFLPSHIPSGGIQRPRKVASKAAGTASVINETIRKDEAKVVDTVVAADVEKQTAYCRCWKSGTFPKCDGTHVKHNKETGDNVGPLLVKKE